MKMKIMLAIILPIILIPKFSFSNSGRIEKKFIEMTSTNLKKRLKMDLEDNKGVIKRVSEDTENLLENFIRSQNKENEKKIIIIEQIREKLYTPIHTDLKGSKDNLKFGKIFDIFPVFCLTALLNNSRFWLLKLSVFLPWQDYFVLLHGKH